MPPPVPTQGPAGMTYDSLVQDMHRYAERGDLLDEAVRVQIPSIINNAERDLAERFKILGYLEPYSSKMKTGEPRMPKPQNWRSTVSINFGTGPNNTRSKDLRLRSYEYIRAVFPDRGMLGEPVYVADYNYQHWLVLPAPNMDYPFEAIIWRLPNLLSQANQTNWLTDLQPNLLLYSAMKGLEAYLRNDARVAMWKGFADELTTIVTTADRMKMTDRAQQRSAT